MCAEAELQPFEADVRAAALNSFSDLARNSSPSVGTEAPPVILPVPFCSKMLGRISWVDLTGNWAFCVSQLDTGGTLITATQKKTQSSQCSTAWDSFTMKVSQFPSLNFKRHNDT
eukprot:s677_g19.t1